MNSEPACLSDNAPGREKSGLCTWRMKPRPVDDRSRPAHPGDQLLQRVILVGGLAGVRVAGEPFARFGRVIST